MSERVTPSKRSKKSAHSAKYELFSRRSAAGRAGLAKVLAEAIDTDPFEIIGVASIATAAMQSNVGELFDELAKQNLRLGPTLWATVAVMPYIDGFARSEPATSKLLPTWLRHIDETTITGIMRRTEALPRDRSTYLVEVTMVPGLVTTCLFELQHGLNDEIVDFWTVTSPIREVADFYEEKYRLTCDQAYAPVPFPEACQNLLIALDGSLHPGSPSNATHPPWPLNLPIAALVIDLAMGQIQPDDDPPYAAIRRSADSASPAAKKLRRALTTWPATTSII